MKRQGHGHRWTEPELRKLIGLWVDDKPIHDIAEEFGVSTLAVNKIVLRMRRDGIPLKRRNAGHKFGRVNTPWTQAEVEYLVRRRNDEATTEQIANELGRSFYGVQGMFLKLRAEGVQVRMLGNGARRLWSSDTLKVSVAGRELIPDEPPVELRLVGNAA